MQFNRKNIIWGRDCFEWNRICRWCSLKGSLESSGTVKLVSFINGDVRQCNIQMSFHVGVGIYMIMLNSFSGLINSTGSWLCHVSNGTCILSLFWFRNKTHMCVRPFRDSECKSSCKNSFWDFFLTSNISIYCMFPPSDVVIKAFTPLWTEARRILILERNTTSPRAHLTSGKCICSGSISIREHQFSLD